MRTIIEPVFNLSTGKPFPAASGGDRPTVPLFSCSRELVPRGNFAYM
jgi:hypothetical protein